MAGLFSSKSQRGGQVYQGTGGGRGNSLIATGIDTRDPTRSAYRGLTDIMGRPMQSVAPSELAGDDTPDARLRQQQLQRSQQPQQPQQSQQSQQPQQSQQRSWGTKAQDLMQAAMTGIPPQPQEYEQPIEEEEEEPDFYRGAVNGLKNMIQGYSLPRRQSAWNQQPMFSGAMGDTSSGVSWT